MTCILNLIGSFWRSGLECVCSTRPEALALYVALVVVTAAMTYEEFEVEVAKGSGPLGLKVVGGADTNLKDVVIKEIVPNTQADIDGQLRPGDHILQVYLCKA